MLSLTTAAGALKENMIDGLVTAPIHKKNIQSESFNYTGHTPYLKNLFEVKDVANLVLELRKSLLMNLEIEREKTLLKYKLSLSAEAIATKMINVSKMITSIVN